MHGTRNRRKYRHCKKPPSDKPRSEEEIQATRSRIFRQHIAHLMRRSGFFDKLRSDAEIEAERERLAVEHSRKLRKKLANASSGKNYIETVWGRGCLLREPSEDDARIPPAAG
jgi:DNA-binding response OmpR family regulator